MALPYVDRMDLAYAAADFALCRAGAMTCAELTAVGLPAAYVPLPIGNGEQRLNALPIVQRGGGLLVEDAELTADWIKNSLLPVLTNIDQVAGMSEAAAAMGRKDADRWLAKAVIEIVAAEQASRAAAQAAGEPPPRRRRSAPRPAARSGRPGAAAARHEAGGSRGGVTPRTPAAGMADGRAPVSGIGHAGLTRRGADPSALPGACPMEERVHRGMAIVRGNLPAGKPPAGGRPASGGGRQPARQVTARPTHANSRTR